MSFNSCVRVSDLFFFESLEALLLSQDDQLCRGTLRIIAEITDPDVIQKILHHMRGPPRAQASSLESATARQS